MKRLFVALAATATLLSGCSILPGHSNAPKEAIKFDSSVSGTYNLVEWGKMSQSGVPETPMGSVTQGATLKLDVEKHTATLQANGVVTFASGPNDPANVTITYNAQQFLNSLYYKDSRVDRPSTQQNGNKGGLEGLLQKGLKYGYDQYLQSQFPFFGAGFFPVGDEVYLYPTDAIPKNGGDYLKFKKVSG